jgi:hypothetical protein
MAQPQLTPEQLKALQALKAQGVGEQQALAIVSGAAAPPVGILSSAASQAQPQNPFGLGAGIPQLPPPEAPHAGMPQGQGQVPTPPVYGPMLEKIGGAIAAPFKAAGGVIKDTAAEAQALGRDIGMRQAGLAPGQAPTPPQAAPPAPQPALATEPVQPPPPALSTAPVAPQAPPPATPMQEAIRTSPVTATSMASQPRSNAMESLILNESGGRWDAKNSVPGAGGKGHFGRLQFSRGRMKDYSNATGESFTPEQFLKDPALQQRVEQWHFGDIDNFVKSQGLDRFVGQVVGGVPMTVDAFRAIAHLGGNEGLEKFLTSGGAYNPADANGTRLSDYAARHGGVGGPSPSERAAQGQPVRFDEMPAPAAGVGVAGAPGALTQATPQGGQAPGMPQSRANAFMEKIYSSPWKGALYNALAGIAEVDPYAHVQMLSQLDAADREEYRMYQDLNAPLDPLQQAQIAKIEYEMQGGGGKEIKSQTWDPEAGGYRVLYKDSSGGFIPAAGPEYVSPSQREAQQASTKAQKEAALVGAEFDNGLSQLDEIMAMAEENDLYGAWANNPVSKTADYFGEQAPFNSESSALRNEWRKRVNLVASTDAVTRLSQIGGSDTEKEFKWMLEMSPTVTSNKSDFVAYRKMMQLARDKIRVREAGGLDEASKAQFDAKREEIINAAKMDSYLN